MKKLLLLLSINYFSILVCHSQNVKDTLKPKNHTDTLSFTIKDNEYTKKYKNDVFVRFLDAKNPMHITVENINPFLYDITMKEFQNDYLNEMKNENIQTYNYNIGSLALNFPEPSNKQFAFIEITDITVKNKLEANNRKIDTIQSKINKVYYKGINLYQDSIKAQPAREKEFQQRIDNMDVEVAQLLRSKAELRANLSNIKQTEKDKTKVAVGLQENFIGSLHGYNNAVIQLQQLFYFYQALKIEVYSPGKSFDELYAEKKIVLHKYLGKFLEIGKEISAADLTIFFHRILTDIKESTEEMKDTYTKFMQVKGKTDEENKLANSMQSLIDWLAEEQKKFSINEMDKIITNIVLLYNSINKKMFTQYYTIDQIKDKTDYVQFVFDAKPKVQNQSVIVPKPIYYKITMPIKNGVQLNVSSGVFFNIGLSSEKWYYKPTSLTDTFEIAKAPYKAGDMFKPAIGVLLQVYRRAPYTYRMAGCFGFSTNATDINYYIGGSFILGKSQRVVISSGLAGGQKDVLNYSFGEGRDDKYVSKTFKDKNPTIPTEKKFKLGAFLSISFNLWGKATKEFNYESSLGTPSSSN